MTADCSLAACSEVHSGFCLKPCRCRMSEKNDSNHANNAICDWKVSDESRKTVANCALARNSAGGFTISAPSLLSCFVSLWTIRSGGAAFQRRRISRSSPSIIFYLRILACDGLPSRDDYYLSNSFYLWLNFSAASHVCCQKRFALSNGAIVMKMFGSFLTRN